MSERLILLSNDDGAWAPGLGPWPGWRRVRAGGGGGARPEPVGHLQRVEPARHPPGAGTGAGPLRLHRHPGGLRAAGGTGRCSSAPRTGCCRGSTTATTWGRTCSTRARWARRSRGHAGRPGGGLLPRPRRGPGTGGALADRFLERWEALALPTNRIWNVNFPKGEAPGLPGHGPGQPHLPRHGGTAPGSPQGTLLLDRRRTWAPPTPAAPEATPRRPWPGS